MDLYTRCNQCQTVFRVTTNDLQASGGQVRCGRCQTVFDAFASLTAKPPTSLVRQAGSDVQETQALQEQATSESRNDQAAQYAVTDLDTKSVSEKEDNGKADVTTPVEKVADVGRSLPVAQLAKESDGIADDPAADLYEWEFKPTPQKRRTGLWLSVFLLMVVSALAQAAYGFRAQLLVNYPQVRPLYEQVCQHMKCEIGLPRLTDQLNIDASDLQLINPELPNQVELTALVRNRARVAVEFPAFELTLTDAQEKVVARRVFLPDDYLPEETPVKVGLAGRGELAVRLYLDTGPLRAAGYRIYLFYPV